MALSEIQQAIALLARSSDVLLVTPEKTSLDAAATLIALYITVLTQKESVAGSVIDAVSPSHLPYALQFLPGSSQVKTAPTAQSEIVLDLAAAGTISNVRQEQLNGGTRLHLALSPGLKLTRDQLEVSVRPLPYDAAVVIGALDLEELGQLFTDHTDFFYNTPIINIDHRAANEQFGTINLVDITASSCAEIAFELISSLSGALTADIATALYAGIVAGTESFQKPTTNPRSFQAAAALIENNADREAVIQHLVKTKPLNLIKLTGAIYARLRYEEQVQLYWTVLEPSNFQESHASSNDIPEAMKELTHNITGYAAVFVLYEADSSPDRDLTRRYIVYLLLGNGLAARRREIQAILSARKQNGALTFMLTANSLAAAEKLAHEKIRQILP